MVEIKDPVCGIALEPVNAFHEKTGQGDYYFCSRECRNRFNVNPGRYLTSGGDYRVL
jgi:YHS domain-containing protein